MLQFSFLDSFTTCSNYQIAADLRQGGVEELRHEVEEVRL